MKDDSLYFRKQTLRAIIQADLDQKRGGKVTSRTFRKYLPDDMTRYDLTNALRFLQKSGWIERSKSGYGWVVNEFYLNDLCFRHGFKKCPKCQQERKVS